MKLDPKNDGITHINVYSKGKTELGRLLSNFADTPFSYYGNQFNCVEGYWYWVMTGDIRLLKAKGWQAKNLGKSLPVIRNHPSRDELREVYKAKLLAHPNLQKLLNENKLPLEHYYVYGTKVVQPSEWKWTAELWNELKQ